MTELEYIELAAMRTSAKLTQRGDDKGSAAFTLFAEEIYRLVAERRTQERREP